MPLKVNSPVAPDVSGDLSVLDAFFDPNRRLALIGCSGAVRHAFTGGALAYIRRRKLSHVFCGFAGVSGAIGTLINFMGGAKATSLRMFSEELADRRLFDLLRRAWGKEPLDIGSLARQFDGANGRGFNYTAAADHPAPLLAVLGCPETGEPIIIEPRIAAVMREVAIYGGAIPGLSPLCTIDGRRVVDGCFTTESVPVGPLSTRTGATDVLVFAGGSRPCERSRRNRYIEWLVYHSGLARDVAPVVRRMMLERNECFAEQIDRALAQESPRVLVVWWPEYLPAFCIGRERTRQLISEGYHTMRMLLTSQSGSHTT